MSINSLDAAIAGALPPFPLMKIGGTMEAAGVLHSLLYSAGSPGAAVAGSAGLGGEALTTLLGAIPFTNPVSGESRILRLGATANAAGSLILIDRLFQNSGIGITTTTGQTINSVTLPARDLDAATAGRGVMWAIEVSAATTNGSAVSNTTITYTNSGGTGSKTGTIASFPATAQAGSFVPFAMAAGDVGIRSVQTLTLGTSYGSGTVHLVAYRVLAQLDITAANIGKALDIITAGAKKLLDNSVLQLLWMPTATTAVNISGELAICQG